MITSILRKMRPQKPHLVVLVVLLVCSFAMTGVIAYQAFDASRGEQLGAREALRSYAARLGEDFRRTSSAIVMTSFSKAFYDIGQSIVAGQPTHENLRSSFNVSGLCDCIDSSSILGTHHFDFSTRTLSSAGSVSADGVIEFLENDLAALEEFPSQSWGLAIMATGKPEPRAIFFITDHPMDATVLHAYGIEVKPEAVGLLMERFWEYANGPTELQPGEERGTNGITADGPLASARILLADGTPIFQTPQQYGPEFATRTTLQHTLKNMEVEVSLNPERVDAVLLGGIPEKRWPMLTAVLVITFTLMVVAIVMIRREAEITRLRSDFIAGVSHELRTPLAQIRMFAETLKLGRVRSEAERHRSLEIIDQEARRLAHLVENVLLFARSERRRSRVAAELTDLSPLLRETIHGFAVLCRTRDIELRPELQEGVVAPVDQGALRQILLNLLDNAVKYGPLRQRITVGLALYEDNARIWVDDEGPGIPEANRSAVFQSFYRLGRDIDSAIAGSGIGLSIVRELATLHGGRSWVDDAPGGGARVVIELPGAYVRPDLAAGGWAVA